MIELIKRIFVLALFLFPFGEIARINLGNSVILRPLDAGIGLLFICWLSWKLYNREKIKPNKILLPLLLFTLSGFLSLVINSSSLSLNEFIISLSYSLRWLAYSSLFFVTYGFDSKFKKKAYNLLLILGIIIVGLGYLQYIYYPNLRNLFYLGWDEHMYRMFSIFLDPNFAGAFFVLFFLYLLDRYLKKRTALIGLILISTLIAVFLTFSRSALIMLLVSSSLFLILLKKKVLITLLFGIVFVAFIISSRFFNIENVNLLRTVSSKARIETSENALKIIQKNPIFGVGFNAYRYAQFKYGLSNEVNIVSHADAGTDNSFLFVLATTGILGFLLYIFMWLRIVRNVNSLAIASIVGVFVNSLFINSLFYPFIMFWIWILLALSIKNHN